MSEWMPGLDRAARTGDRRRGAGAWLRTSAALLTTAMGAGGVGGCVPAGPGAPGAPGARPTAEVPAPPVVLRVGDFRAALAPLREQATAQVLASSRGGDPFLRANAVEAAQGLPERAMPLVQLALEDKHPAVRFSGLVTLGKLKLADQGPAAERLLQDSNGSVRAAAMYALQRCGQKVDLAPLYEMMGQTDAGVRGNAVMLVGLLGQREAIPILREKARIPMPRASSIQERLVHLQIAEAILRLGDDSVLDAVRTGAYSEFEEVRILAVQILGQAGDRRFEGAVAQFLRENSPDLRLAAAATLARLGDPAGLGAALDAVASPHAVIRAHAAVPLGLIPDTRSVATLAKMLTDPSEQVRLAAAAAVLRALAG